MLDSGNDCSNRSLLWRVHGVQSRLQLWWTVAVMMNCCRCIVLLVYRRYEWSLVIMLVVKVCGTYRFWFLCIMRVCTSVVFSYTVDDFDDGFDAVVTELSYSDVAGIKWYCDEDVPGMFLQFPLPVAVTMTVLMTMPVSVETVAVAFASIFVKCWQDWLRSAGRGQLDVPRVRLPTYGGRAFCHAGPSAWNALPDFLKMMHFLCLLLDSSLNISTSHFTSTPSAFEVILQLMRYTNYLLTDDDDDAGFRGDSCCGICLNIHWVAAVLASSFHRVEFLLPWISVMVSLRSTGCYLYSLTVYLCWLDRRSSTAWWTAKQLCLWWSSLSQP